LFFILFDGDKSPFGGIQFVDSIVNLQVSTFTDSRSIERFLK